MHRTNVLLYVLKRNLFVPEDLHLELVSAYCQNSLDLACFQFLVDVKYSTCNISKPFAWKRYLYLSELNASGCHCLSCDVAIQTTHMEWSIDKNKMLLILSKNSCYNGQYQH